MFALNPALLIESQLRVERALQRASLRAALGPVAAAPPPDPFRRRERRPLMETVEVRRTADSGANAAHAA